MSLLYEAETKGTSPAAVLAELPVAPDPYVADVVAGVGARSAEIDELVAGFSIDWSLDRMPAIDRTLLRMGTYELLARPDVPTGVVISEAVDLAREYSTEESTRFVNGVLASVALATRGDTDPGRPGHGAAPAPETPAGPETAGPETPPAPDPPAGPEIAGPETAGPETDD